MIDILNPAEEAEEDRQKPAGGDPMGDPMVAALLQVPGVDTEQGGLFANPCLV